MNNHLDIIMEDIQSHLRRQKLKCRLLKLLHITLVIISTTLTGCIPIIEALRPVSKPGIIISVFGAIASISIAFFSKFELANKIMVINENIKKLNYINKRIHYMIGFNCLTRKKVEKLMTMNKLKL